MSKVKAGEKLDESDIIALKIIRLNMFCKGEERGSGVLCNRNAV